jgi:hypothetical protein
MHFCTFFQALNCIQQGSVVCYHHMAAVRPRMLTDGKFDPTTLRGTYLSALVSQKAPYTIASSVTLS